MMSALLLFGPAPTFDQIDGSIFPSRYIMRYIT